MKIRTNGAEPRLRGKHHKTKLVTLDHLDGRTIAAKRAKELIHTITSDLGGPDLLSEASRQLVQRASLLSVFLESSEARWLAGEQFGLEDYLKAIDRQRRILETLGLERRAKEIVSSPLEYASRGREARS